MSNQKFNIDLLSIHWLDNFDDPDDRCAHGKILVIIDNEVVADNSDEPNDWWTLSAAALHLLRTLASNHTESTPVAPCLIPGEGHHIDHQEDSPIVHIETVYPIVKGVNWWVTHSDKEVHLETVSGNSITVPFEVYKQQVLSFVDKVEAFYKRSKPKNLPNIKYDRDAYIKFWAEWKKMRETWN